MIQHHAQGWIESRFFGVLDNNLLTIFNVIFFIAAITEICVWHLYASIYALL